MTGSNALPLANCSVSRRTGGAVPIFSSSELSRRAACAVCVSRLSLGWNAEPACRFSVDLKSGNISRPALEMVVEGMEHSRRYRRREDGRTRATAVAVAEEKDLQKAKYELLTAVLDTGRGLTASAEQRVIVEEAMVGVEKFDAGMPVELNKLDGSWQLQYTTAPDVVQILQASATPFLQVGQIFQKFECGGRTDGGIVKNVVRWSIPGILQDDDGATLVVTAKFSVVSPRSIALSFEEAQLGQVAISAGLQAFLAPAVLPRTFLNLEVLQYFLTVDVRVPLLRFANPADNNNKVPVGLWYYLTYLDNDMLLGRALSNGGVFIFRRTQQLQLP